MKHNITKRLVVYFTSVLLLFALIVSILFFSIFSHQTTEIYKNDMEKRAIIISNTLSEYLQDTDPIKRLGKGNGMGAYIKMLDDIAMSDVWIVDKNAETISVGGGKMPINYSELPKGAMHLISQVFEGEIAYSDCMSGLLGCPSISVGAPIYGNNDEIVAALLLNSHLSQIDTSFNSGRNILLISILIALILGLVFSILLSRRFTEPLQKMEKATLLLAQGDYKVQTQVNQLDEIGSLAKHIDLLAERLGFAEKESEKLEQMRKDYISNISHELRTPVTVIRGSLETLCDKIVTEPEKISAYYKEMLAESVHLERMVNDLLELSRLQNPDYTIEKTPLNLIEVLSDAVRSARHVALKKEIALLFNEKNSQFLIDGDYGRLRQMFLIILDNAIKFSEQGQNIEILTIQDVDKDPLTTTDKDTSEATASFKIIITDHGIGISEQDLPQIFERFYKSSSEKNIKGTGLGLSIAKQIAELHNISLSVESIPNQKTSFIFSCK